MTISIVNEFPWEGEYLMAGLRELLLYGKQTFDKTWVFYEVRNVRGEIVMTAGVAVWSLVRQPEAWLLLTKAFSQNLRESLELTREALSLAGARFPGLICEVLADNAADLRFAKAVGWKPTGVPSLRNDGFTYIQFGVR